ncbi:MAG: hypothetical protein V7K89_08075 [Nostoc sp.]|uniref:hypothetical protein n=1 Tax=Nostoc sp. TaxID=1180 RepID=UPI002FF9D99B
MTTVIFVHGTGVREAVYASTFLHIEETFNNFKRDIKLVPCSWGEAYGAKFNAARESIPNYDSARSQSNSNEDYRVRLWDYLYKQPLFEIQILSSKISQGIPAVPRPGQLTPSQQLKKRVEQLTTSSNLQTEIKKAGIAKEVFDQSHQAVIESQSYARLLEKASGSLDEYYAAIARAIVAEVISLCNQQWINTPILFNPHLRNQIVDLINKELTQDTQSRGQFGNYVKDFLVNLGGQYLQGNREMFIDFSFEFSGDILLYQAKGKKIREFIWDQVEKANANSPVVLLAHSLGGIACVDLLVNKLKNQPKNELENQPKVDLLITVGSQAPFLYEIDALQSLSYGESLPENFPKWLNIYDLRDLLSYVGERDKLFARKIIDVQVDNQQSFPNSHGAYWYNDATWNAILRELP